MAAAPITPLIPGAGPPPTMMPIVACFICKITLHNSSTPPIIDMILI
jgi:hypothetical protein